MSGSNYIRSILIFAVGLGIGGGVGWLATKLHYDKVMEDRVASSVEEARSFYVDLINQTENEIERDEGEDWGISEFVEEDKKREWPGLTLENRRKEEYLNRPERVRYETFSKTPEEEEVNEVALAVNNDKPREDIYVINADQFAHEKYGYDKVTLFFWEIERLLTTDDYDILDVPDLIGTDWEDRFGEFEPNVVYVRNEAMESDYEVILQHDSYYDVKE